MYDNLDIITIGESLIEFSSENSLLMSDTFTKYYGGDTLAVAISALRSGSKVGYITKVKNDGFGEYLLDCWQSEGLDSGQVKFSNLQNGVYFSGQNSGVPEMQFYRKKTAASTISIEDIDLNYIKSAKFIFATGFVQSLSLNCRNAVYEVFKFAKENGAIIGYYPNFRHTELTSDEAKELFDEVREFIDIVFINTKDDLIFDTQSPDKLIENLINLQIENSIVIKNGVGIWANNLTESVFVDIPEFEPVDYTGYTSAIIGAYTSLRLKGEPRLDALKYANILGMLQAKKTGAIRSIPKKEEVLEVLSKYYG